MPTSAPYHSTNYTKLLSMKWVYSSGFIWPPEVASCYIFKTIQAGIFRILIYYLSKKIIFLAFQWILKCYNPTSEHKVMDC